MSKSEVWRGICDVVLSDHGRQGASRGVTSKNQVFDLKAANASCRFLEID
jgi:hypothetical protein